MAGAPTTTISSIFDTDFYRALPVVPAVIGKSCHPIAEMSDFAEKGA